MGGGSAQTGTPAQASWRSAPAALQTAGVVLPAATFCAFASPECAAYGGSVFAECCGPTAA